MARTKFTASQIFNLGDVVVNDGRFGVKVIKRIFVDVLGEYRWLTQEVKVDGNEAVATGDGKYISLASDSALRMGYTQLWTKSAVTFQKGDVFKGANGKVYVAESSSKMWSLEEGTWATVTSDLTWPNGDVKLTPMLTVAGQNFSTYLG